MIFVIASKLMFIPTCVDRFIHIAVHFPTNRSSNHYHRNYRVDGINSNCNNPMH